MTLRENSGNNMTRNNNTDYKEGWGRRTEKRGQRTGLQRRRKTQEVRRKKMVKERKSEGRVGVLIETRTKANGGRAKTAGEMEKWEDRETRAEAKMRLWTEIIVET